MANHAARELRRLYECGPYPGEDFHRLKVTGNGESRWLNITPAQLKVIAGMLDETELYSTLRAEIAEALGNRNRSDFADRVSELDDDDIAECERLMVDHAEALLERES